ncbi:hypothetical protein PoB_001309900, partial [Plakobranchus ocellatus]
MRWDWKYLKQKYNDFPAVGKYLLNQPRQHHFVKYDTIGLPGCPVSSPFSSQWDKGHHQRLSMPSYLCAFQLPMTHRPSSKIYLSGGTSLLWLIGQVTADSSGWSNIIAVAGRSNHRRFIWVLKHHCCI